MRKLTALLALVASLFVGPAYADFTAKDASAATITFKNPGTCTAVVCVPVAQLYDGTNVVTLTTAGADAVSNTLTGVPVYGRMQIFNGTTWDRWQGAVTATLAAETTKVIGTVRMASGGVASGSYASGAFASGAFAAGSLAAGAGVDGWDLGIGATTDAAATQGSTGSVSAKLRTVTSQLNTGNASLATIATNSALPLPTQAITVPIGGAGLIDSNSKTMLLDPCQYTAHVWTRIDVASAASSVLVAGTSAKKTYICSIGLMAAGTTNLGIVEGSGSTCGTSPLGLIGGNTAAKGLNLTAQAGASFGNGQYAIAASTVNANDICLINGSAVQVSGFIVTATP